MIRGDKDVVRHWDPSRDTHRGRVEVGIGRDVEGNVLGAKITIQIKPTKPDQLSEHRIVKSFVVDDVEGSISAGMALFDMLRGDTVSGNWI